MKRAGRRKAKYHGTAHPEQHVLGFTEKAKTRLKGAR